MTCFVYPSTLQRDGRRIVVRSEFDLPLKDALKTCPGARWSGEQKVWHYPPTPFCAKELLSRIRGAVGTRIPLQIDPEIDALAAKARRVMDLVPGYLAEEPVKDPGMKRTPWRHQHAGIRLITGEPAVYLSWDMGTGKTLTCIASLLELWDLGANNALILAPTNVVGVWPREFEKHLEDPESSFVVAAPGSKFSVAERHRKICQAFNAARLQEKMAVAVVNHESCIHEPLHTWMAEQTWDIVIVDEFHRFGTPGSKRTRYLCERLAPRARRRVGLSGTAMRTGPKDLYSQCKFLDPGLFGTSAAKFREEHAVMGHFGEVQGFKDEGALGERFGAIAYHVAKRDVLDLPPVTDVCRQIFLPAGVAATYKALEDDCVATVQNGTISAPNRLVALLRLLQITSGHVPVEGPEGGLTHCALHTEKQDDLTEFLTDLGPEEPVVVFCQFKRDLDAARQAAIRIGRTTVEMRGGVNQIGPYWEAGNGNTAIVQLQSGGVGVDFTRAAYAYFFSAGFNRADYLQARARLDRPGQTRPVTLAHAVAKGTVDEDVYAAIEGQTEIIDKVVARLKSGAKVPA
jgi:SNF2 family DNA or RNA helicase